MRHFILKIQPIWGFCASVASHMHLFFPYHISVIPLIVDGRNGRKQDTINTIKTTVRFSFGRMEHQCIIIAPMESPLQFITTTFPLIPLYQFVFHCLLPHFLLHPFTPTPTLSIPPPVLHLPPISPPATLAVAAAGFDFCMLLMSQVEPCMCACVHVSMPSSSGLCEGDDPPIFWPPPIAHFHSHKGLNLSEMSSLLTSSHLLAICSRTKARLHSNHGANHRYSAWAELQV